MSKAVPRHIARNRRIKVFAGKVRDFERSNNSSAVMRLDEWEKAAHYYNCSLGSISWLMKGRVPVQKP